MKWALVIESTVSGYYVREIREADQKPPYHPTQISHCRWIAIPRDEEAHVGDIWNGESFHPPRTDLH
ncbi:hypothetical protein [Pseudomonas gingeri]|uniref:Uncharacterized protein n=1 Tax=Pseudomonas gingeri TaxID=117681 RepID=A0A7Y7Y782_9PSED|nr:hypothetical protein [Pseudomonas gingeri]NWA04717.1 hypothetical protein [Pseudomonas gingeri]NWA18192.1 hypothetical protein [Pseudomonas gingeri]NWA53582.1 hypothetical protein [Pseudomonas gingeri]NWA99352.1 hypothetical protein [Pseudomonas gingeri]NWB03514.1 hypothetical protein [Pseudomonas gingeri]